MARADFKPKLSANLRKLKDKVVEAYRDGAFPAAGAGNFAPPAGGNAANLNDLFEVCVAEGYLVRVRRTSICTPTPTRRCAAW